ncbi:MAG: AAA family ATPase [bacterium]|nr:AAA family ATPase [bacterium]
MSIEFLITQNTNNIEIMEAILSYDQTGYEIMRPSFNIETDMPALERRVAELKNVRLIIIDPIMAFMGEVNAHNLAEVRGAMAPLASLAEKHDLAIALVHHLNKSSTGNSYLRVSGSTGYLDAARCQRRSKNAPAGRRKSAPLVGFVRLTL